VRAQEYRGDVLDAFDAATPEDGETVLNTIVLETPKQFVVCLCRPSSDKEHGAWEVASHWWVGAGAAFNTTGNHALSAAKTLAADEDVAYIEFSRDGATYRLIRADSFHLYAPVKLLPEHVCDPQDLCNTSNCANETATDLSLQMAKWNSLPRC
jgi:hypothetical protein